MPVELFKKPPVRQARSVTIVIPCGPPSCSHVGHPGAKRSRGHFGLVALGPGSKSAFLGL